jgi:hypothetical protein
MKVSKEFQEMLWEYSSHVVSVIGRHQRERESWMGSREDDYAKCEAAFTQLTQLWETRKTWKHFECSTARSWITTSKVGQMRGGSS